MTTEDLFNYIKFISLLFLAVGMTIGGISALMWAYNKLTTQSTEIVDITDYNQINLDKMEAIRKENEKRSIRQANTLRTKAENSIRL